ncbi:CvpA family protein [Alkalimarinus sediminis]|uniref:CvpA family protein n=1 Tax=Alkalimarinus sediminis TaxID=1632866 RepID=A0A9E8HT62_9ALTE|nr:CvpA family protein [Alkalimarinus sediminis]UZW76061.1 CvpA family protein [Alkalimarinus sediminis]
MFNWADWSILAIISISSLFSLKRGFVKEALSLVTWVAAFIIARTFNPNLQTLLVDLIDTVVLRAVAAFAILFIGTLIVGAIINNLIGLLVKITGLSTTDRLLGVIFGVARGVIIVVVTIALLRVTPMVDDTWWKESVMITKLQVLEQWSRTVFEDQFSVFMS